MPSADKGPRNLMKEVIYNYNFHFVARSVKINNHIQQIINKIVSLHLFTSGLCY